MRPAAATTAANIQAALRALTNIGGTNVKFGYSVAARPHDYSRFFSSNALRAGDPVQALAPMIDAVVADAGLPPWAIVATVPGFIDTDFDRVLFAGNIPGLNGRLLASELSRRVGCPVLLERDAILALWAVVFGPAHIS